MQTGLHKQQIMMNEFKFDRAKPFYPYVVNYVINYHGILELISRKFYDIIKKEKSDGRDCDDVVKRQNVVEEKHVKFIREIYTKNLEPTIFIGDLALKSEQRKSQVEISISEISSDIYDNHMYLLPLQLKAGGMLLIMAYELTKDTYDNKDEIWNFLYHCRNAAAHGGHFNITNIKRFPAKWGHLEITTGMNGENLFKDDKKVGLLSPGDPLYLLYDLERIYIK